MKRFLLYLTAIILLSFISCCNVSALTENTDQSDSISPSYVSTQTFKIGFSITSGISACTCRIIPKKSGSITSATGRFEVINNSGKTVKTYNQQMKKSGNSFRFSENYKLPSKGTYYLKATVTCYKNGIKQETITKTSSKRVY